MLLGTVTSLSEPVYSEISTVPSFKMLYLKSPNVCVSLLSLILAASTETSDLTESTDAAEFSDFVSAASAVMPTPAADIIKAHESIASNTLFFKKTTLLKNLCTYYTISKYDCQYLFCTTFIAKCEKTKSAEKFSRTDFALKNMIRL